VVVVCVVLVTAAVLAVAWSTRDHHLGAGAGFLAFSIDPLAQMLRRRDRVGKGGGIALAMAVIGLVLFVIGLIVIPPVATAPGPVFGVVGALLALPITAAVKIVLEELRRSPPAEPAAP